MTTISVLIFYFCFLRLRRRRRGRGARVRGLFFLVAFSSLNNLAAPTAWVAAVGTLDESPLPRADGDIGAVVEP